MSFKSHQTLEFQWPETLIESAENALILTGDAEARRNQIIDLLNQFARMTVWRSLYRNMDLRRACCESRTAIGIIWHQFSIGMKQGYYEFVDQLYRFADIHRDQLVAAFESHPFPYNDGYHPIHYSLLEGSETEGYDC